jgi:putative membrane protein insertion efficiency factor
MPVLNKTLDTVHKRNPASFCVGFLVVCFLLSMTNLAQGLETNGMKAPKNDLVSTSPASVTVTKPSTLSSALLGSVHFFQKWISPIDGPRCSFSPTCSQFGYEAVHDHGPFFGVVMTADRLMRCNYWTEESPDYVRLPNRALYDPVTNNLQGKL